MKRCLLLPAIFFGLGLSLAAAETPDFSSFKTADEFWKHIAKLQEQPAAQPKSRDEAIQMVMEWLGRQQTAAEAFAKAYPQDQRRWQATLLGIRAAAQMRRFSGKVAVPDADRQRLAEILNAPDVPELVKGEAAFMEVMMYPTAFDHAKPETFAAFHKAAADFLEKYPNHPLAAELKQIQLRVLNDDPSPEGETVLKGLAAGSDARVAEVAKAALDRRQKMADLKSKPVDLKFVSSDGRNIDIADLRGKVVVVDFWASWCGPCLAEMPSLVGAYKKLHDKGFEIIGISLDQDKGAMESAMKKFEMAWPQYLEPGGAENKFARTYGIATIPTAWLIDKKGMLRESTLRGEELIAGAEKLLSE